MAGRDAVFGGSWPRLGRVAGSHYAVQLVPRPGGRGLPLLHRFQQYAIQPNHIGGRFWRTAGHVEVEIVRARL